MFQFFKALFLKILAIVFPKDYYSWQTLIYLGLFSFAMSWVARFSQASIITEDIIATIGWVFFALGIGWFLDQAKFSLFGIKISPWVMGAIVCTYLFGLLPWGTVAMALISWPLLSVAIAAAPHFFTWELQPKIPTPPMRLQLILLLLIGLLLSSWFQFYFRLQGWFKEYPSVLVDDFKNSEFVYRIAKTPDLQGSGTTLLVSAENELSRTLNNTPWPYVERWLMNLDENMDSLEAKTLTRLEGLEEQPLWQLAARPRTLNANSYAIDLMAIWSGPASTENGYYLQKTCIIHPVRLPEVGADPKISSSELAQVKCDLAIPKKDGKPLPET